MVNNLQAVPTLLLKLSSVLKFISKLELLSFLQRIQLKVKKFEWKICFKPLN